jgi:hypothetical protein
MKFRKFTYFKQSSIRVDMMHSIRASKLCKYPLSVVHNYPLCR